MITVQTNSHPPEDTDKLGDAVDARFTRSLGSELSFNFRRADRSVGVVASQSPSVRG
jgi:hypothetical protein